MEKLKEYYDEEDEDELLSGVEEEDLGDEEKEEIEQFFDLDELDQL